jgi:spermidine/putrescine transport system substrate-binding protein
MSTADDIVKADDGGIDRRTLLRYAATTAASVAAGGLLQACGSSASSGGGAGAAAAAAAPTVKPAVDGDLSWYTWEQYVPPKVVKAFEKEYGVKVKQTFFASSQESLHKVAAGVPYDLITTSSTFMEQFAGGKLLQSFDPGDLKNWSELAPYFEAPWYDHDKYRYTIPYGYGPTGIMYRKDKVGEVAGDWNEMWNHPEAKGHIYLLSSQGDTLGMSLVRNGADCNSAKPDEVAKAADELLKLKPSVASLTTDLTPPVARGDAWLMEGWATPVYLGVTQSKNADNIGFVTPKAGPMIACDTLSISRKAKSPGTALLFMDWLLKPENNAQLGAFTILRTGAKAGNEAFSTAIKKYPIFDFADDLLTPASNWKRAPTGARAQLWNQQWARVSA